MYMERTRIAAIFADSETLSGKEVVVGGWARTIRDLKTFGFIELNDGSCFRNLQVVMSTDELENYKEIAAQNVGAALIVKGTVVLTPEAKQPLEVKAASIEIEGKSTPDYPLQKKRHSVEFLRTIQHLRPRTNLFSATFRVRSVAAYAVHEFFQSRGFVYVQTPIITGSDCEGAGEMFQVTTLDLNNVPKTEDGTVDYSQDFFGKKTSLTVSGQLNAENFAMAFGDVYTFGPTFRAENSNTQRHAAEFWMIEPEMAFCDLAGDMDVAEAMIKHIIRRVLERCPDEINFFNSFVDKGLRERLEHVMTSDFGRVSYTEAVDILMKHNDKFDYKVEWGTDLQTEHERFLTEQVYKKPVFVTDYPKEIKAFYMRLNDDGKTVAAADCLVPGIGEIIGGSQREERLELLESRIKELGMNPEDYWWYCDLRRYGSCHHAGFGLGFERMVMYLTGVSNIRDVELHPRTVELEPCGRFGRTAFGLQWSRIFLKKIFRKKRKFHICGVYYIRRICAEGRMALCFHRAFWTSCSPATTLSTWSVDTSRSRARAGATGAAARFTMKKRPRSMCCRTSSSITASGAKRAAASSTSSWRSKTSPIRTRSAFWRGG